MKKSDDTLSQLRDSWSELKNNTHMLDEMVSIEEQMKYFKYSQSIHRKERSNANRNHLIGYLFTPELDVEDKRHYLSVLAGIVDVVAYRALETYHKSPLEPELTNWSALALAENRILLNTELSGEKQFFVSTGLGGKDKKLRFFSVIASESKEDFTHFQVQTLIKELEFRFEKDEIELEQVEVRSNYIKLFVLSGLNHDPRVSVDKAITEANLFGNYVDKRFLFTNIKKMEDEEIKRYLDKKQ